MILILIFSYIFILNGGFEEKAYGVYNIMY